MIPELVKELIDWYRWREKNRRVLVEYHQKVFFTIGWLDTIIIRYNGNFINYRSLKNYSTLNFIKNREGKVAILPKIYQYSSGLTHPAGYKRFHHRKLNTWFPDSITF